jgi:uncharacterized protein
MAGESRSAAINVARAFLARLLRLRLIRTRGVALALTSIVVALTAVGLGEGSAAAAGRTVAYGVRDRISIPAILARAKRGDTVAAVLLGRLYSTGHGVPQNYYEAAKWFYRAADAGNGGAQYALGMLYNKGEGVRRDYVLSYMWLNLSAAQATGDDRDFKVRMRDAIASKMTPRQVEIAQDMAVKWYRSR